MNGVNKILDGLIALAPLVVVAIVVRKLVR
jgi:hypothetical protein